MASKAPWASFWSLCLFAKASRLHSLFPGYSVASPCHNGNAGGWLAPATDKGKLIALSLGWERPKAEVHIYSLAWTFYRAPGSFPVPYRSCLELNHMPSHCFPSQFLPGSRGHCLRKPIVFKFFHPQLPVVSVGLSEDLFIQLSF